jgi:hypothetical protein
MAVILNVSNNGWYIPMDGPWMSPEDNSAYEAACNLFEELRPKNEYIVLIKSHHWTTHGYWIETVKRDISFPDRILKGGGTIPVESTAKVKTKRIKK